MTMTSQTSALLLAALLPLGAVAQETPPPAPAPQAAPAPTAPAPAPNLAADPTARHHRGFFIRPELGFAYLNTSSTSGSTKAEFSGTGFSFGLSIGGAVSEDLVVAFSAWNFIASDPDLKLGGVSYGAVKGASVALVGYGVLVNWYLQPSNFYLALTPALTRVTLNDGTTIWGTQWGLGLRATAGKEWWVSDHWGLGLAASFAVSSNKDSAETGAPTWGSAAFNLIFSATYN
jgi:hypothetical protein